LRPLELEDQREERRALGLRNRRPEQAVDRRADICGAVHGSECTGTMRDPAAPSRVPWPRHFLDALKIASTMARVAGLLLGAAGFAVMFSADLAAVSEGHGRCNTTAAPEVVVRMRDHEDVEVVASTAAELTSLGRQKGLLRSEMSRVPGAYIAGIGTGVELRHWTAKTGGGFCQNVIAVNVHLNLTQRRILLAREISSDPCLSAMVLRHERKHAAYDERSFADFFADIERLAKRYFENRAPEFASEEAALAVRRNATQEDFVELLKKYILEEVMPARMRLHQHHVDTTEESAAIETGCDGRLGTTLR
jgi:hypothetical protein